MTSDILPNPDMETERAVTQAFLRRLPSAYQIEQAILFGSRARGNHRLDSDLDLAVVLKGERRDFIDTKLDMAGIAFDVLMATGILVQPLPLWNEDLVHPERFINPGLIRNIAAEGIGIETGGAAEFGVLSTTYLTTARLNRGAERATVQ